MIPSSQTGPSERSAAGSAAANRSAISNCQSLFYGLYEAILITTVQGKIAEVNNRVTELFALEAAELLKRNVSDIICGLDEKIMRSILDSLAIQKHVLLEAACMRSDGVSFPAEIAVHKIALGEDYQFCFSVRDVTTRNETEGKLEQAQEELLKMEKMKTRLETISRLAHEINNPLQTLITMVEGDNNIRYAKPLNRIVAVMQEMRHEEELKNIKYAGSSGRMALLTPDIEHTRSKHVLIVDDEPMITKYFSDVITSSIPGAAIDCAANGAEAVTSFHVKHHAVVILDINMPVMTGEQAFHEIKRICKERKWEMPAVIFCTGFTPPDSITQAIARDSLHCFLAKPISMETLVNAVKNRFEYQDLSRGK